MAITNVNGTPSGPIKYTKVTDTSADWPGIANSTYFFDKGDGLVHYKNSGGTVLEIFSETGGALTYADVSWGMLSADPNRNDNFPQAGLIKIDVFTKEVSGTGSGSFGIASQYTTYCFHKDNGANDGGNLMGRVRDAGGANGWDITYSTWTDPLVISTTKVGTGCDAHISFHSLKQ